MLSFLLSGWFLLRSDGRTIDRTPLSIIHHGAPDFRVNGCDAQPQLEITICDFKLEYSSWVN